MENIRTAVEEMETLAPYSSLKPGRRTVERHDLAVAFLEKLSGGEMLRFIVEMLPKAQRAELWKLQSGSFADMFNDLTDAQTKRSIVASLEWPHSHFAVVGMAVGRDMFKNRHKTVGEDVGGRPSKKSDELLEQVREDHLDASVPTSRYLAGESKKRGEAVVARNMTKTYREVFDESPLAEVVSYSTYRRYRTSEFIHSATRTDVCDVCVGEANARRDLQVCIDQNRKFMRSAHWKAQAPLTKLTMADFDPGAPKELRAKVTELRRQQKQKRVREEKQEARKRRK